MEDPSNLILVVLLLGATQGLFLTLLLLTKPINKRANLPLALLIISYSAFIVDQGLAGTEITQRYPHLLSLAAGAVFLQGPLHYLYARALIRPRGAARGGVLIHFVPFALFYLYFLFPFYLTSGPEKLAFIQSVAENGLTPALQAASWGVLLQGLIYMTATLGLLRAHRTDIKESFSSIEEINLDWLRTITVLTLGIWILGVVIEVLQTFGMNDPVQPTVPILITVLIYVMGYLGLRQPEIFSESPEPLPDRPHAALTDQPAEESRADSRGEEEPKYVRSGLTAERAETLHARLVDVMESERPFLDSNLKLNRLARSAGISANHLSQVINELRGQNFYDFVNSYRIEEAKRLILDPDRSGATLLSIAYEVGFNSKSAFNTAFKKHTDTTPSQFRKSRG